jgi:hypothetical protein
MSFASLTDAVAVAMDQWKAQYHAFIVETVFKNGDSVVKTQQVFCKHFSIIHHGKVCCHSTTHLWLENLRTSASALKKKPPGTVHTM